MTKICDIRRKNGVNVPKSSYSYEVKQLTTGAQHGGENIFLRSAGDHSVFTAACLGNVRG